MLDYWTSFLAHWAEKELEGIGYKEDLGELNVHKLTELTTRCVTLAHWDATGRMFSIIIPNQEPLYRFLVDKNYRIANCVFRLANPNITGDEFFKLDNYSNVIINKEFIAFENVSVTAIDIFNSWSLVAENQEDLDRFQAQPIDLWDKITSLFKL